MALFGVGTAPVRAHSAEAALTGGTVDDLDLAGIGAEFAATLDPPDDLHASGGQRRRMAEALVPQVLAAAIEEAEHA